MKPQLLKPFPAIAVVVALLLSAGGCANEPSAASGQAQLPAKNMDRWVMPLDAYLPGDMDRWAFAESLLAQDCAQKRGYVDEIGSYDPHAKASPSYGAGMRRLFNLTLAKTWGYHAAPAKDPAALSRVRALKASAQMSGEQLKVVRSCVLHVRKTGLPPLSGNDLNLAAGLENQALVKARGVNAVQTAAGEWHRCMATAGVPDLPTSPAGMPSDYIEMTYHPLGDPAEVTSAERALATRDARCRESSGYQKAAYEAEWDANLDLLAENADVLARIRGDLRTYGMAVDRILSQHAPQVNSTIAPVIP